VSKGAAQPQPGAPPEQLAHVIVGRVVINAALYTGYSRGENDWADGIRLEDPDRGGMLVGDDDYPREWIEAGIRDIAVVGIPYHPDAQRPDFGVGSYVRLVPEPNNPKDRRAIAVRSADGRRLAGYVPADRLDDIWSTHPAPQVGLVVWDHYSGPVRERLGLYVVAAPSIELRLVPPQYLEAERARRNAIYEAGGEQQLRTRQTKEAQLEARKSAKADATPNAERIRAARLASIAERQATGSCVSCGGPIESHTQSGDRQIRCERCRMGG
jgi:HIRAN domain